MARTLPESPENLRLLVDLNFDLRNCLEIVEPAEIFEALQDAERICEQIDDRTRRARVNSYLTHAHWVAGNLRKALAHGEDAVRDAGQQSNPEIRIPALYHLALVQLGLGHHAKAEKTFSDVIEASEQRNFPAQYHLNVAPKVLSRTYLARCLAEMGQYDTARETAMAARDQAKSERENYAFAFTELALGHVAMAADDHETAVYWLSRSVKGFEASQAKVMLPVSQAFHGYAIALSDQFHKALPIIEDAIASSLRLKVWQQQGLRTAFLSEPQIGLGDFEGAMETLRFARQLSSQHEDEPALAFIDYQTVRVFHLTNGALDGKHHALLTEAISRASNMQMLSLVSKCKRMLET